MDQSQQGPTPPDFGPYETDACLLFYNDATPESNPRRLRIVKTLEGSPQEGFTYSCCMIVEDFTPLVRTTPDEIPNKRYVMKIFDSRYSRGLRKSFGCMDFTLELSKVVNNVDDAKLAEIHALTTQKISVRDSQNELLQYLFEEERIKPTITRFTLLGIALGEEGEEIREDENIELPTPDLAYQEGFLMIMQRLLYRHELEMFEQIKDLSYFPKLVATGSVCMIDTEQPKPDSKLRKFECPAIIMSLLPGESLASLVATNEDNRYHSSEAWDPMLIDIGALKYSETPYSPIQPPNQSSKRSSNGSTGQTVPGLGDFAWPKEYNEELEDTLDQLISNRASLEYAHSAAFRTVTTKRFEGWYGRPDVALETNVWRLLMESLFSDLTEHSPEPSQIGLRSPRTPATPSFVAGVLRYVRQLMDKEYSRGDRIGSWYARATSLITILVTASNITWSSEDSNLVQTKLRQCDESFSKQIEHFNRGRIPLEGIQTWALQSTLWVDSIWHEPDLDDDEVLHTLGQRFKVLNDNPFPSYFEDMIKTSGLMPLWTLAEGTV
ncbi:hypothetical protein EDD37DRAFT_644734 [Exophiala viscosa]|uniref:uncharacterized protein n=1 Tax=Exophiala viscosa TaxID=2486360 RepID=UPI00218ED804|nr:hypothetical protein EDD37DRAFT_644734 [Exophiala viscosa]